MTLILGGYSYGSMITAHLPSTDALMARFIHDASGSAEAEIKLRALRLADQWNTEERRIRKVSQQGRTKPSPAPHRSASRSHSIVVGGEESEPGTRRVSHDSRRSMDSVRKSFDFSRKSLSRRRRERNSVEHVESPRPTALEINTSYLMVSPLLPPVSAFATMFTALGHSLLINKGDGASKVFTMNPTLAIYGDGDAFTSQKKLARWAAELSTDQDSLFQAHEVQGAGHFWREDGVEGQLLTRVGLFVDDALSRTKQ